ncbi:MAG: type II toxin-antitoxin system VapC family toxin [Deltaproteobacteria bacterium]|nr:type II toxin-antitoxin system VapC family toxin [Deltaproteobacteria bacterium]
MLTPDVNVLVYAHRVESPDHRRYAEWLTRIATGPEPFGLSDLVCAGFVRIVTHPRIWRPTTEPGRALAFVDRLRRRRGCRLLTPGSGTWTVFARLVEGATARGKLVADAYLAALAIEHGCTLATCDADFARFADLRWTHPLRPST